jgi:hypothetical protein
MIVALGEREDGGGLERRRDGPAGRSGHGFPEKRLVGQATVALAAFRVQDPQLRPPARRAESVPGDHHLRPLAHDVATQADPRSTGELEPKARRLGERTGDRPGQLGRLEENEQRIRSAGKSGQPMQPLCRPGGTPARTGGPSTDGRQIRDEEIHRSTLEQDTGHRQPFVERLRCQDHEPFEPDATGDGLHRIETPGEIQPGHDGTGRLCLRHEPESERGLAARVISADRQAGLAGNATGAENRVKCGEAGGHDRAHPGNIGRRSFNRSRSFDYLGDCRQRPDDGTVPARCFDPPRDPARGPTRRIHPEPARSCRTPAIPEGRQSGRDIGGNGSHRPMIEHPFYSSSLFGRAAALPDAFATVSRDRQEPGLGCLARMRSMPRTCPR